MTNWKHERETRMFLLVLTYLLLDTCGIIASSLEGYSGVAEYGVEPGVSWSNDEVRLLIEGWSRNAEEVNLSRNENYMQAIADYIGSGKTAKQVRTKLKKMRARYVTERQRVEEGKGQSKWRYYQLLNVFGHKIYSFPNRRVNSLPKEIVNNNPRAQLMKAKESNQAATMKEIAAIIAPQNNVSSELPPIFPYDPEVPKDVAIDAVWSAWNASLPYAMTDSGIRTLLRSGFRDVSHLELLKRKTANIAMLNLNYHDKLALEHALESDGHKSQQYQVITNDDGTVIEVRGCGDTLDTLLLSAEGVKLAEWNKSLKCPLTDLGVAKVMKAGFITITDVTSLMQEEAVEELELSLRDQAALRKIIEGKHIQEEVMNE